MALVSRKGQLGLDQASLRQGWQIVAALQAPVSTRAHLDQREAGHPSATRLRE